MAPSVCFSCQLELAEVSCWEAGVGDLLKIVGKKFGGLKRKPYFCTRKLQGRPSRSDFQPSSADLPPVCSAKKQSQFSGIALAYAEIAQLVEHDLAKVGVASSSLVFRSTF